MKNKLLITLLLSFWFCTGKGQKIHSEIRNDTLFEYETIIIYDTIWVRDTAPAAPKLSIDQIPARPAEISLLQIDTLHKVANLIIISEGKSATFSIDGIIINENIKIYDRMKKLNFATVVLFAFQSMVMAQTNWGITGTAGMWGAQSNCPSAGMEFTPVFGTGLFAKILLPKQFFIEPEFNYSYLMSNYSYKTVVDELNWVVVGEGESASNYHQFSVPVQVGFKIKKFSPYIGAQVSYRLSESWLKKQDALFGLLAGLNYQTSERLTIGLQYYYGLNSEYEVAGTIFNPATLEQTGSYKYSWKSQFFALKLHYHL